MSHWNKKEDEFEAMHNALRAEPGLSGRELAKRLDVAPSTVTRRLPALEEAGYLLYEDERGRLWPFDRKA